MKPILSKKESSYCGFSEWSFLHQKVFSPSSLL